MYAAWKTKGADDEGAGMPKSEEAISKKRTNVLAAATGTGALAGMKNR